MNRRNKQLSQKLLRALAVCAAVPAVLLPGQAADKSKERLVHMRSGAIYQTQSAEVGSLSAEENVAFAVTLPWRNQAQLQTLLKRLYDPGDPSYHHFLTSQEFTEQFAPTQTDYNAVISWANSNGIQVTAMSSNRHIIQLSATTSAVSSALHTRMGRYMSATGREYRSPSQGIAVSASIARRITGFAGLDTSAVWHANFISKPHLLAPKTIGSGPSGGMSPSDIRTAYGLASQAENGTGQTIAVMELASYAASDINAYTDNFSLPRATLQNITVSSGPDVDADGTIEATLDVELIAAMAPTAATIAVYEAPNTEAGVLAAYNQIAVDNTAKQVSTSWGLDEASAGSATLQSENEIFQQFAAQGQSLYASSGDSGAFDNGTTISVDDPASQPYVVGVGGTSLTIASAGGAWLAETTWNGGSIKDGAGGGGISSVWPLPSFQSGVSGVLGSTRNVPDVSLNADPDTGYAIYVNGAWEVYGGTSCAAPLWAAFHSLVNERRVTNGAASLGFANPLLYAIYATTNYTDAFHDISDSSTNLYYSAVSGYDRATGLGSIQGASLLGLLATDVVTGTVPSAPQNLQAAAGDGKVALTWSVSTGATSYTVYRHTATDSAYASIGTTTATQLSDTGVSNGVMYYYVVTASDSTGESGYSNEVTATPQAPSTAATTFTAGIHLMSLPYSYSGKSLDAIFGYSGVTLCVYDPAQSAYVLTPTAPADSIVPGVGYWVRFPQDVTVAAGTPADTTQDFEIPLSAGWNQIGDPFTASIAVSSLEVSVQSSTYSYYDAYYLYGLINPKMYRYDPATNAYVTVSIGSSLVPDQGYWIYAYSAETLVVPHP